MQKQNDALILKEKASKKYSQMTVCVIFLLLHQPAMAGLAKLSVCPQRRVRELEKNSSDHSDGSEH